MWLFSEDCGCDVRAGVLRGKSGGPYVGVAELADAGHLKCPIREGVWVRVPSPTLFLDCTDKSMA